MPNDLSKPMILRRLVYLHHTPVVRWQTISPLTPTFELTNSNIIILHHYQRPLIHISHDHLLQTNAIYYFKSTGRGRSITWRHDSRYRRCMSRVRRGKIPLRGSDELDKRGATLCGMREADVLILRYQIPTSSQISFSETRNYRFPPCSASRYRRGY